jgi:hypothetical protein
MKGLYFTMNGSCPGGICFAGLGWAGGFCQTLHLLGGGAFNPTIGRFLWARFWRGLDDARGSVELFDSITRPVRGLKSRFFAFAWHDGAADGPPASVAGTAC